MGKKLKKPFGSGLDRFLKLKPKTEMPGPGQYKPEESYKILDKKAFELTE